MVTHDRAIAAAAQRTVAMRDGRMVDDDVATALA
jgi:predicted ABC-type transport system involved in lysophospholipase L1 biosynthesis ATPase subunit